MKKTVVRIFFTLFFLSLYMYNSSMVSAEGVGTIKIPAGTQIIEDELFYGCERITSVSIPSSINSIADFAFYGCSNLERVYYEGTQQQWNRITIGKGNDTLNDALIIYLADYPTKEIIAISPWAYGGGTDKCLRAFCAVLEEKLNTSITVINQSGAYGVIGHEAIADAEPDGYTIGMITWELTSYAPQNMSEYTYQNYTPICRINKDPAAIFVNTTWAKENKIIGLASFISYCKDHPGEVTIGGSSLGSPWHVAGGYLMNAADITIKMTTYTEGSIPAIKAAAQGKTTGVIASTSDSQSYVESGELTAIGIMDTERNNILPEIPTCKEQGYDFNYAAERGIAVPIGVDKAVVEILREACGKAVEDSEFENNMANLGQKISYLDGIAYGEYLKQLTDDTFNALNVLGLTE